MNLFKFASALCVLIGSFITYVSAIRFQGASTPTFYLVSSSLSNPTNLKARVYHLFDFPNIY
jgi:hypothetical protein